MIDRLLTVVGRRDRMVASDKSPLGRPPLVPLGLYLVQSRPVAMNRGQQQAPAPQKQPFPKRVSRLDDQDHRDPYSNRVFELYAATDAGQSANKASACAMM